MSLLLCFTNIINILVIIITIIIIVVTVIVTATVSVCVSVFVSVVCCFYLVRASVSSRCCALQGCTAACTHHDLLALVCLQQLCPGDTYVSRHFPFSLLLVSASAGVFRPPVKQPMLVARLHCWLHST